MHHLRMIPFLLLVLGLPTAAASAALLGDLPGIELIGPEETLAEHTAEGRDGSLQFRHPDGAWVRLITSIEDPEIRNRGEGAFFPPPPDLVEQALRAISPELLRGLEVQIFLLPYPRSGMLGSSADGLGIYLTPGVRPYSPEEIHYLVAHELGHAFHRLHIPYGDPEWDRYRVLRGLEDESRFRFDGPHADRPQEILAEDFRVLFGGELARGNGAIENPDLLWPDEVPGLEGFFRDYLRSVEVEPETEPLASSIVRFGVAPNPVIVGGELSLRVPSGTVVTSASVYGAGGRKVSDAVVDGAGRDGAGETWAVSLRESLRPGAYWLRLELRGAPSRVLPIRVVRR